jgi:hypothetical protein
MPRGAGYEIDFELGLFHAKALYYKFFEDLEALVNGIKT